MSASDHGGGIASSLAWAWYPEYPPSDREVPWWWFLVAGVALRFVAWGLSFVLAILGGHREKRTWLVEAQFALASLVTGALGGLLVWWLLTTFFPDIAGFVGEPATMQTEGAIEIALYVCFAPPLMLLAMLTTEVGFRWSRQPSDRRRGSGVVGPVRRLALHCEPVLDGPARPGRVRPLNNSSAGGPGPRHRYGARGHLRLYHRSAWLRHRHTWNNRQAGAENLAASCGVRR